MRKSPAVSVMMCVYNSERYLPHSIEGVLAQTFSDFELIAADDGSTDGSVDILHNYAKQDGRIKLSAGAHAGLVAARNRALAASEGEFIAIADSDDRQGSKRRSIFLDSIPSLLPQGAAAG